MQLPGNSKPSLVFLPLTVAPPPAAVFTPQGGSSASLSLTTLAVGAHTNTAHYSSDKLRGSYCHSERCGFRNRGNTLECCICSLAFSALALNGCSGGAGSSGPTPMSGNYNFTVTASSGNF
jgi:hypothetical protein